MPSTLIRFPCPQCGHSLKVPTEHAGKKGRCPKCGRVSVTPTNEPNRAVEPEVIPIAIRIDEPIRIVNQGNNSLALGGLILGGIGIAVSWIPYIGWLVGGTAIILSLLGFCSACRSRGAGIGYSIAGGLLGLVILLIATTVWNWAARTVEWYRDLVDDDPTVISWADPSHPLQMESFSLQLLAARIENRSLSGFNLGRSGGRCLSLMFRIKNLEKDLIKRYTGFRYSEPTATDNFGNVCGPKDGLYDRVVYEDLQPGETVTDSVAFERPVDHFEFVDVKLPAKGLGQKGSIHFRLPREAIERR